MPSTHPAAVPDRLSSSSTDSSPPANVVPWAGSESARIRQLTARMAAGDDVAFAEFYDGYCDRLFRYLLMLTRGNEDLSRELLQATMTKVARRSRQFSEEAHLWHWLAAIARHGFLDALRRTRRGPEFIPLPAAESSELAASPASEDPWEAEAPLVQALDHSLLELDEEEQGLIQSCYFEGLSHQALATERKTSAKAVESKLARLRQKLRGAILRRLRYEND